MVIVDTTARWERLADQALAGDPPSREDALAVLASRDDELLQLLGASFRVRSAAFGRKVVWCAPAYANKKAFIRNDKEIICVDLAR